MRVGVGYSEHQDTEAAGAEAVRQALARAGQRRPCDFILLFATARHDARYLRSVVSAAAGGASAIVGGAAVGAMDNERFGYAGDQVGLAAFWLDRARCHVVAEGGLVEREDEAGEKLGRALARLGVAPDAAMLLLYDAINRTHGDLRLNLATPLLQGLERGLGFTPTRLVGAGLQGDYECSAASQWIGQQTVEHHAMALAFSGEVRVDCAILHGCKPTGPYYTVTKADKQAILEIDGRPALSFIQEQVGPALPAEAFPFYMIFGVNRGDPDAEFNEKNYANRLCLAIDKDRDAIVMFESDMVAGTRFQIMYRSLDLGYIPPKIDALFDGLGGRRPTFAFYIDCAGRAAKYGGEDLEDAVVVQQAVAGRAPLLGIYSGVEIAPIHGRPRTLDWTGVFCLLSVPG